MYTENENKDPGKFEGNQSQLLARILYDLIGISAQSDEFGDSCMDYAWFGLIEGRLYDYIVMEDSCGFFTYEILDKDKSWVKWELIRKEMGYSDY